MTESQQALAALLAVGIENAIRTDTTLQTVTTGPKPVMYLQRAVVYGTL